MHARSSYAQVSKALSGPELFSSFYFQPSHVEQTRSVKHLLSPSSQLVLLEISLPGENYISSCELLALSLAFHKQGTRFPCPGAIQDELGGHPLHWAAASAPCTRPACPGIGRWRSALSPVWFALSQPRHGKAGTLFQGLGRVPGTGSLFLK